MTDFTLNEILQPQKKKTNLSDDISQDQEDRLWDKMRRNNPEVQERDFVNAMQYVRSMRRIHQLRNKKGYELASIISDFKARGLYESLGYDSFNEYVSDDICPFPRSTAYRYVQVGNFMDQLDVDSQDFHDAFYQENNVDRIIEYDDEGNIDQKATEQANNITSRVNYMNMAKIGGLYNKGRVGAAEARELMAKSIILEDDDFKLELREARGEEDPKNDDDELFYQGLKGHNLVVPLGKVEENGLTDEKAQEAKKQLQNLIDAIDDGVLFEESAEIHEQNGRKVGSTSTKYYKASSGRYYGIT